MDNKLPVRYHNMQSPELTKRKHHNTTIDVLSSPEKGPSENQKNKALITEYDIRPSFANEPHMRYETKGDQLIPIMSRPRASHRGTYHHHHHQNSKLHRIIHCFTFK
jgi:hypothetical protein